MREAMKQPVRRMFRGSLFTALTALCLHANTPPVSFDAPGAFPMLADAIATGDFNGDGVPDLAGVSFSSSSVGIGNGDGTFQAPVYFAVAPTTSGQGLTLGLAVADFNHDGWPEVAAGAGSNVAAVTNRTR